MTVHVSTFVVSHLQAAGPVMAVDLRKMAIADTKGEEATALVNSRSACCTRVCSDASPAHCSTPNTPGVPVHSFKHPLLLLDASPSRLFLFADVRLRSMSVWRPRSASRPTHVRTLHTAAWASERAPPFGSLMQIDLSFLAHVSSRLPLELRRSK